MNGEPSAIDQVFRHWPAEWPLSPRQFIDRTVPLFVEVQNVIDHLESAPCLSYSQVAPPWPRAVLYWKRAMGSGLGTEYSLAFLFAGRRPDDDAFVVHGLVIRCAPRVYPTAVLTSVFGLVVPAGGELARRENGDQGVEASFLGWDGSDQPMTAFAREMCGDAEVDRCAARLTREDVFRNGATEDVSRCLFTFSFANCRNVVHHDRGRTSPPKPWQKAGVPTVRFRVLAIDGRPTAVGDPSEPGDPTTPKRRLSLHIVRGHFARYTPERPLFGKYTGTFWMPQHVRGSAASGVAVKDYRVGPPPLATAGAGR